MNNLHQLPGYHSDPAFVSMDQELSLIDSTTVTGWIEEGKALLIDVREPQEYEDSRIPGSFLVPMSRFDTKSFPPAVGFKTVLICQRGLRAIAISERLNEASFQDVYILEGGIDAWEDAGFEVEE